MEQGLLLLGSQNSSHQLFWNSSGKTVIAGKVAVEFFFSFIMRFSGESFHIHIQKEPQKRYVLITDFIQVPNQKASFLKCMLIVS